MCKLQNLSAWSLDLKDEEHEGPFKNENRKTSPKNLKSCSVFPWKDPAEHFLATPLNTEKWEFNYDLQHNVSNSLKKIGERILGGSRELDLGFASAFVLHVWGTLPSRVLNGPGRCLAPVGRCSEVPGRHSFTLDGKSCFPQAGREAHLLCSASVWWSLLLLTAALHHFTDLNVCSVQGIY